MAIQSVNAIDFFLPAFAEVAATHWVVDNRQREMMNRSNHVAILGQCGDEECRGIVVSKHRGGEQ